MHMRKHADIWSAALTKIPQFRGKVRIADSVARLIAFANDAWGTCSPAQGATISVNLRDRIERHMWGGCYERNVQQCLRVLLSSGDVFVDIGAHIGYHTVLGASLVGPQGRVFAFEADPCNFVRLSDHLRVFPWSTAMHNAVWSSSSSVVFESSSQPGESGWGTLTAVRDLKRGHYFALDATSLDDWWNVNQIGSVSAVKIDAEGSEVEILRGATEFLKRARPAAIIEANDVVLHQANASAFELAELLRNAGYELFEMKGRRLEFLDAGKPLQSPEFLGVPAERTQRTLWRLQRSGFLVVNLKAARGSIQ
jgi:FkbM family methyltransferase